jgi:SAM-dependent methyltransferase
VAESAEHDELIRTHYREQAAAHELAPTSTMADHITRQLELDVILACVGHALGSGGPDALVGDVGCGNGHLLAVLRERFADPRLEARDFSPEMVELARRREIDRCDVAVGDVRALDWADASLDVLVSERCIINVLDEAGQVQSLQEFERVVRPGGHLVLVEAFTDGFENLNRARDEIGLEPTEVPFHNRWLDAGLVDEVLATGFEDVPGGAELAPRNFLSTHYFVSRVLYPAVTQRPVRYNTEFVQFFQFLPPSGNYSPIQLLFLRRRS